MRSATLLASERSSLPPERVLLSLPFSCATPWLLPALNSPVHRFRTMDVFAELKGVASDTLIVRVSRF